MASGGDVIIIVVRRRDDVIVAFDINAIATAIAEALPIDNVTVSDDRPTNMAGALGGTDGYVAAIGTGSFLGRQSGAEQRFIGGWGLRLGDEASGAWLGRRVLSRVLDWRDGVVDGRGWAGPNLVQKLTERRMHGCPLLASSGRDMRRCLA